MAGSFHVVLIVDVLPSLNGMRLPLSEINECPCSFKDFGDLFNGHSVVGGRRHTIM
uniref:Uncharacterized protein n=1 Tax=Zea mays TaxID=4577 RepID=C4J0V7_MAIZE|nr:unknown [Zea mays]